MNHKPEPIDEQNATVLSNPLRTRDSRITMAGKFTQRLFELDMAEF